LPNNLGFSNQTGSGVSAEELSSFISFVNLASSFYSNDYRNSLSYISVQMTKKYGSTKNYTVFVQVSNSVLGWSIYATNLEIAAISAGVDKNLLNNSYLFLTRSDEKSYYYLSALVTGSGLTSKQQVINNIIISEETNTCTCNTVTNIQ